MNNTGLFNGSGVALATPFLSSGAIDFEGLERLINHVIKGGINYVVTLGTTGEAVTLNDLEKKQVIDFTIEIVNQRIPIVVGIGGNNTQRLISRFQAYNLKQVQGILSVSPYYNKPSQQGIIQHFSELAKHSPLPIILYNVPARTGSNMQAQTTLNLAQKHKNIVGIKEASGDMVQIMNLLNNNKRNDFLIISGDDFYTLPMMSLGGAGVISVTANAFPFEISTMVQLLQQQNIAAARAYHFRLLEFTHTIFADGSPAGIKEALNTLQICNNTLRLPLTNVNTITQKDINTEINKICTLQTQNASII